LVEKADRCLAPVKRLAGKTGSEIRVSTTPGNPGNLEFKNPSWKSP